MTQRIRFHRLLCLVVAGALSCAIPATAQAQSATTNPAIETRIEALAPDLEAYTSSAMKAFGVPGLAIGIVAGDRLVYAKGFGVRSRAGGAPVDAHSVFQVGSTTKAFLAATIGIMVDRKKFRRDDRVVDLYPEFQLKDPWVTREFRMFDLLAQRSGLPPYANDALGFIGLDGAAMNRSLRYVEPVSSFRTTFAYTNITHILAGDIVAKTAGVPDWNAVLRQELLDPLGMKESSYTAAAIVAASNHAVGYRWSIWNWTKPAGNGPKSSAIVVKRPTGISLAVKTSPSQGSSLSLAPVAVISMTRASPSTVTEALPMAGLAKRPTSGVSGGNGRGCSGFANIFTAASCFVVTALSVFAA
jgi:CubicO group peptidase (beta-lactamase class C family)